MRLMTVMIGLVLLLSGPVPADQIVERLAFTVTYRGMFSLGADMQIADVELETRLLDGQAQLRETRLEADSSRYPVVESLYPIRYRLRSWSAADGRVVGFESREQTRRLRHRLYLADASERGFRRLDGADGEGARVVAQLDAGQDPRGISPAHDLVDRLALLQRVRALPLAPGVAYEFDVSNGKETLQYRVKVETAQTLDVGGAALPTWKLRFDGYETNERGLLEAAHQPVFIWVDQGPGHAPLRADSRHPIGLFRLEFDDAAGDGQRLAAVARQDR